VVIKYDVKKIIVIFSIKKNITRNNCDQFLPN